MSRFVLAATIGGALLFSATVSLALSPSDKCEAAKLKTAGKYGFCRLKADAKAIKTNTSADYSKCDEKYSLKWGAAESTAGAGVCRSEGDALLLQGFISQHADAVAIALAGGGLSSCPSLDCGNAIIDPGEDCDQLNLNGATCASEGFAGGTLTCAAGCSFDTSGCVSGRFVDNGDGTVTDHQTGLVWEKKTDDGSVHDRDNTYSWSTTGSSRDGTAFVGFLGELNTGVSADGGVVGGCFAGRCDWRLPTIAELEGIVDCNVGSPCQDPIFGPFSTIPFGYWSSTSSSATDAWLSDVTIPLTQPLAKVGSIHARAVSGAAIVQCGNGVVDAGESCDQGELNGETCVSQGFPSGGTLACTSACTFDTSACIPTCGNGAIDAGESCDQADLDGETCVTQGFDGGTLACTSACTFDSSACTVCGNGVVEAGESCDQGQLNGETCDSQGFLDGTLACTPACTFETSGCLACPGAIVGGACWVQGANGADCDTTCATLGSGVTYDPATATFAGSGGTTANCQAVITALGASATPVFDTASCDAGCTVLASFPARCTLATTSTAILGTRMCACQ